MDLTFKNNKKYDYVDEENNFQLVRYRQKMKIVYFTNKYVVHFIMRGVFRSRNLTSNDVTNATRTDTRLFLNTQ